MVKGTLKITASSSMGTKVKGLQFRVRNLDTGKRYIMKTNKEGTVEGEFEAEKIGDGIDVEIESIIIDFQTYYYVDGKYIPSHILSSKTRGSAKKVEFPYNKRIKIKENERKRHSYSLPLFRVIAFGYRRGPNDRSWVESPLILQIHRKSQFLFAVTDFKREKNICSADFYLPAAEALRVSKLKIFAIEREHMNRALAIIKVPSGKAAFKPVIINFYVSDYRAKIARFRKRIIDYFSHKEFKGILDDKTVDRLSKLRVVVNPEQANPVETVNGTTTYNSTNQLEFTREGDFDTIFHEWNHHLNWLILDDDDDELEKKLGEKHDVWIEASSPELAWDEARCHFGSVLLNRAMDNPNTNGQFNYQQARNSMKDKKGRQITNPGNVVEGIATTAMIEYYAKNGYKNTRSIYSDFLKAQKYCADKKVMGHPPRTTTEFFKYLREYNKKEYGSVKAAKMNKTIDGVMQKYGIPK